MGQSDVHDVHRRSDRRDDVRWGRAVHSKLSGGLYDLATPNPAYFARVDALFAAAAAHGTVVFADPIEFGGFWQTIQANSAAAGSSYGQFLGARYRNQANIVWMSGNDMIGFNMVDKFVDVAKGIQTGGALQLQTAELDWPVLSSTLDDPNWVPSASPTSINLAYTYNPTYALLLFDYNRSGHLPNIFIEGNYEAENLEAGPHPTNAHDIRAQAFWSDLSGATGWFYGNHWEVYLMDNATWASNLAADKGAPQMLYVKQLFEPRKLVATGSRRSARGRDVGFWNLHGVYRHAGDVGPERAGRHLRDHGTHRGRNIDHHVHASGAQHHRRHDEAERDRDRALVRSDDRRVHDRRRIPAREHGDADVHASDGDALRWLQRLGARPRDVAAIETNVKCEAARLPLP